MSAMDTDALEDYRASPLRFPIHAVTDDGTAVCNSLAEDQQRYIEHHGLEDLKTLAYRRGEMDWDEYKRELCGNCRRSLESRHGESE